MLSPGIEWPAAPGDLPLLLGDWVSALTGVVVHDAVTVAKGCAHGGVSAGAGPGDLPRVVNARLGQLLLKLW